ncbi:MULTISPECIES: hypothetical protein [unclassified Streptomyces]|uniref:Uncharacterized protein n=1 Tax=Streptomyces sp. NBC_00060 TaxID=2975636 RepID=A0AAU2GS01_9ACTN
MRGYGGQGQVAVGDVTGAGHPRERGIRSSGAWSSSSVWAVTTASKNSTYSAC